MNPITLIQSFLTTSLLILELSGQCAALADDNLPDASTVMQRAVERATQVAHTGEAGKYVYEKRRVIEELDEFGNVANTTEEIYEVILIQGLPFSRLVKIQNRDLTEDEIKAENRKRQEFRQKISGRDPEQMAKRNENWLTPALVERYDFKVERRDSYQNRPVLVLPFHPKTNCKSEKAIEDKVLNRLKGTVWVDEKEAEIARVQVGLTESILLGWFGLIGSIKQCDLDLERKRLVDGVWANEKQTVVLVGRKLFSAMRYRTLEESYNFSGGRAP